jgi:hypothetical protein
MGDSIHWKVITARLTGDDGITLNIRVFIPASRIETARGSLEPIRTHGPPELTAIESLI